MFDFDDIACEQTPSQAPPDPVVKLGILPRQRVVMLVAVPYRAFRDAADVVRRLHPELGDAVARGAAIPGSLSGAVYDYEVARARWQAV